MKINNKLLIVAPICTVLFIFSCSKNPKITEEPDAPYSLDIGIFPNPNLATDNPLTREGVKLGRMLFYEKMLSKNNQMSCASCHIQQFAFSDTSTLSIGVQGLPGKRQACLLYTSRCV